MNTFNQLAMGRYYRSLINFKNQIIRSIFPLVVNDILIFKQLKQKKKNGNYVRFFFKKFFRSYFLFRSIVNMPSV